MISLELLSPKYISFAILLGALTSFSLVLGAIAGIMFKPGIRITAAFTGFGAGALLAALGIELVAPTIIEYVNLQSSDVNIPHSKESTLHFFTLLSGMFVGGMLFYLLNELLNNSGGYLRTFSTTLSYFNHTEKRRAARLLHGISKHKLIRSIHPQHADTLLKHFHRIHFHAGSTLLKQNETEKHLLYIESGKIQRKNETTSEDASGRLLGAEVLSGDANKNYPIIAASEVIGYELSYHQLESLRKVFPGLDSYLADTMSEPQKAELHTADTWHQHAIKQKHHAAKIPTLQEIKQHADTHDSAPLAIWLGNLLDGIPDSYVIGSGFLIALNAKLHLPGSTIQEMIPYTLIGGLFLSNLPEAMSGSVGLKNMGWSNLRIILLWSSLVLITALGSGFGFYYGAMFSTQIVIAAEGIAAGAMLMMIVQTMIPEAVHLGGPRLSALSILAGYLAALAFKLFE